MSKSNSINAQIFYALKISEKAKVPFLFMSAPGMGKSTTVKWFAEAEGYELETLRGNSTSEDEIMGYDVVDEKNTTAVETNLVAGEETQAARSALHLIPSWYKRVLKSHNDGKRTLLFIDEITTCSDRVQSALLHLIFDRQVHEYNLPDDTLIVAAGNYSQSLGNTFGLIPPLMNRFCIFNIIPDNDDIAPFLSKYKKKSTVNAKDMLVKMTKNKKVVSDDVLNRIGEYIEIGVEETTKLLQSPAEKKIDLKVTDTQSLYSDIEKDEALCGFVTPRTLCYYRDASIAAYLCFGKEGIVSNNYKKIIEGLVGIGLTRDGNSEVKKHSLVDVYYKNMTQVVVDLEKLENDKIAEYEKYFSEMVDAKDVASISYEDLLAINSKISELKGDVKVENIDRPIEPGIVTKICEVLTKRSDVLKNITLDPQDLINGGTGCSLEEFVGYTTKWNNVADALENLGTLVENDKKGYSDKVKLSVKKAKKKVSDNLSRLRVLRNNFLKQSTVEASLVPEFHTNYIK